MKMISINKHSTKLKNWRFKMPNAPYLNRYEQLHHLKTEKTKQNQEVYKMKSPELETGKLNQN